MQVKTSELNEIQLDWIVATCEDIKLTTGEGWQYVYSKETGNLYSPSRSWEHGGPIIDREDIAVVRFVDSYILPKEQQTTSGVILWGERSSEVFISYVGNVKLFQGEMLSDFEGCGPTKLVAAMRCYVASKLGDVVEIPDDLFAISK